MGESEGSGRRELREAVAAVLRELDADVDVPTSLRAVQDAMGYVPPPAIALIAEGTGASPGEVFELVRVSAAFDFSLPARHRVAICRGDRCHKRGSTRLVEEARAQLEIDLFQTTPDGALRLESFNCLDECASGPNVRIDGTVHGKMDAGKLREILTGLLRS